MTFKTRFNKKDGVCTVQVDGKINRPNDSLALQKFAREFGAENDCRLFLFDMRNTVRTGGIMEAFEVASVPADHDRSQANHKIALLYKEVSSHDKFMETVAFTRGYTVRVFNNENEAKTWLVI